jgi:hypothetical protein
MDVSLRHANGDVAAGPTRGAQAPPQKIKVQASCLHGAARPLATLATVAHQHATKVVRTIAGIRIPLVFVHPQISHVQRCHTYTLPAVRSLCSGCTPDSARRSRGAAQHGAHSVEAVMQEARVARADADEARLRGAEGGGEGGTKVRRRRVGVHLYHALPVCAARRLCDWRSSGSKPSSSRRPDQHAHADDMLSALKRKRNCRTQSGSGSFLPARVKRTRQMRAPRGRGESTGLSLLQRTSRERPAAMSESALSAPCAHEATLEQMRRPPCIVIQVQTMPNRAARARAATLLSLHVFRRRCIARRVHGVMSCACTRKRPCTQETGRGV